MDIQIVTHRTCSPLAITQPTLHTCDTLTWDASVESQPASSGRSAHTAADDTMHLPEVQQGLELQATGVPNLATTTTITTTTCCSCHLSGIFWSIASKIRNLYLQAVPHHTASHNPAQNQSRHQHSCCSCYYHIVLLLLRWRFSSNAKAAGVSRNTDQCLSASVVSGS